MTGQQTKGRAREELVVQAAARAIAERGLANVRVADVAQIAGMTPGHVTYYFPSKVDLLMRAIRDSEQALAADVAKALSRIRDPWKRLDRLVELSAASGPRDPGWMLWFQVWLESALDPEVALVHDELDARWRSILTGVIRYGCARGAFQVEDADETALLLSALLDGLSTGLTVGSSSLTRADLLRIFSKAARVHLQADPAKK